MNYQQHRFSSSKFSLLGTFIACNLSTILFDSLFHLQRFSFHISDFKLRVFGQIMLLIFLQLVIDFLFSLTKVYDAGSYIQVRLSCFLLFHFSQVGSPPPSMVLDSHTSCSTYVTSVLLFSMLEFLSYCMTQKFDKRNQ